MRIRRRWVIGSLVGAGALSALAVGVAVASPLGDDEKPRDKVIERAEAILGLESGRLEDALQQAQADIAKDRRNEHLDQLVKDGVITQAEADEIKAWLDSMPEGVKKLPGHPIPLHKLAPFPGFPGEPPILGFELRKGDLEALADVGAMLDKLVGDGVISREQADEMLTLMKRGGIERIERFKMHPRPFGPRFHDGVPFEWKLRPDWKPQPAPTPAPGT